MCHGDSARGFVLGAAILALTAGCTALRETNNVRTDNGRVESPALSPPLGVPVEEAASPPAIIEESRKACSCYQPVEFAYAQVHLRSDVRAILDSAAQTLAANPEVKVTIVGHSDAIGSARYNYRLSLRRAQVVKAYPVSKGVTASRLETVAKGEKAPLAPNTKNGKVNPGGRAINRRIELRVR